MTTNNTQPARGTRDFLPADVRRREYVIDVVRRVYERYGFEPLETPAFENIETLLGKYGDEGNKLIFKILKRGEGEAEGGADLALRYDLTVPLARVVAQYQNELPKFFRRYQIQPVWRADRPARGRFREFYQCDIDAIGSTSPVIEVDILGAVSEVLATLGFDDFVIRLNHRGILSGLLEAKGIPAPQHAAALTALDKFDKIGREGVQKEMIARGISEAALEGLLGAFDPVAPSPQMVQAALKGLKNAGEHLAAVDSVETIISLSNATAAASHLKFDPSLARGLSYYTGAIMEVSVEGIGSLGGGGRYDNLIGIFLGRDIPACGFSLGLERIIVVMTERKMFPESVAGALVEVMVAIWNDASSADSLALAAELRKGGLRTEVYPEPDKLGKQFKYAASRNVPFVAIVGDDERAEGEVALKDLRRGEQTRVPRGQAAAAIGRLLNRA